MNRYYSNVLYNGLESITLPLHTLKLGNLCKDSSESEVGLNTQDHECLPHSIIRGDNNV